MMVCGMAKAPRKRPTGPAWPKWERLCTHCNKTALMGDACCKDHGGPLTDQRYHTNWKRYLMWVLLPERIRPSYPMPTGEDELHACMTALAETLLTGDVRLTQQMRVRVMNLVVNADQVDVLDDDEARNILSWLPEEDVRAVVGLLRSQGYLRLR